jgi:hypothetical protein
LLSGNREKKPRVRDWPGNLNELGKWLVISVEEGTKREMWREWEEGNGQEEKRVEPRGSGGRSSLMRERSSKSCSEEMDDDTKQRNEDGEFSVRGREEERRELCNKPSELGL